MHPCRRVRMNDHADHANSETANGETTETAGATYASGAASIGG